MNNLVVILIGIGIICLGVGNIFTSLNVSVLSKQVNDLTYRVEQLENK